MAAPHQILNAVEAKHHFGDNDVALVIMCDTYSSADFEPMVEEGEWQAVYVIEDRDSPAVVSLNRHGLLKRSYTLRRLATDTWRRNRIDELAGNVAGVKRVYLGNYNPLLCHFAQSFPDASVILLDDGTDTLTNIEARRVRGQGASISLPARFSRLRLWLRNKAIGATSREPQSVTFFTTYDFDPTGSDSKVVNDYRWLRSLANASEVGNDVYFLGQPLAEDGWMTKENYYRYVAAIKEYFADQNLIYVPHKREADESVRYVQASLSIPVMRFKTPIEHALLNAPHRPKAVASLNSSALDNCRSIFGNTLHIYAFYVSPEHLLNRREFIQDIYDYFRSRRDGIVKVIDPFDSGLQATASS